MEQPEDYVEGGTTVENNRDLVDDMTPAANAPKAGLPVAGYKPTQPQAAIDAVNVFKELEERTLRHIDKLMNDGTIRERIRKALDQEDADKAATSKGLVNADARLLAVGRTQLQGAFMFLCRAVFQPGRVTLPEDEHANVEYHTYNGAEHLNIKTDD